MKHPGVRAPYTTPQKFWGLLVGLLTIKGSSCFQERARQDPLSFAPGRSERGQQLRALGAEWRKRLAWLYMDSPGRGQR